MERPIFILTLSLKKQHDDDGTQNDDVLVTSRHRCVPTMKINVSEVDSKLLKWIELAQDAIE